MPNPCKSDAKRILLVEGKDDCHVILGLCGACNIPESFGVYECGDDAGVLKRLNALIVGPNRPETVGIVFDADERGALSRWEQIKTKILRHGYAFPDSPDKTGTILKRYRGGTRKSVSG